MTSHELKAFEANLSKGDTVFVRITEGGLFVAASGTITRVGRKSVNVELTEPVSGHTTVRAPLFSTNNSWNVNNGVFPVSDTWGTSVLYGSEGNGIPAVTDEVPAATGTFQTPYTG
jgi:hypothetical protein